MPEKKVAALFLEIFMVAVLLVTLSSIALPHIGQMMDKDGASGYVGRVAGMEPACPEDKTLNDYFRELTDFSRIFNTANAEAPELP